MRTSDAPSEPQRAHDVVDAIYDVALEPSNYELLSDVWEAELWPQIQTGDGPDLETSVFAHFKRAEEFLDLIGSHSENANLPEIAHFVDNITSAAALVFDRDLQVAATNPTGARLLSTNVGASITDLPILQKDLNSFLVSYRALLDQAERAQSLVRVRRKLTGDLIVFQLRPLHTRSGETFIAAVSTDVQWPDDYREILNNAFGLSATESDIIRLLVDCRSVQEIADERGRTVGTVRNQIKKIFAKTGARSQAELVRLIMSIMVVTTTVPEAVAGRPAAESKLASAGRSIITGPDGRKLEYLILGDPDGAPVFYLQTELGLSRLPRPVEEDARRRGLRIISPIRAGFGQSDPTPDSDGFGDQVARDLLTVMDHEGIERLPVITMAADNAFAARMHLLRPGSVAAIIATSGCFPFINDEQAARQQPLHRLVHSTARYFPRLLPFVAKASFKYVRRMGKQKMVELMFAKSPADLKLFENPDIRDAVIEGSEVALSDWHSGHEAFIRQCLMYHTEDQLSLFPRIEGQLPYHSMNGQMDPSVHPDTLAESQAHYPWIEFHIYPDAGQWLFFQYPDDVFDVVEPYLQR